MHDAMAGGDSEAVAAGWSWLASLPRAVTAHAERGSDPLAAVRTLLAALGDPHVGLHVVHVVGSKGKGSTALLIEALLRGLGRRTFTFTSPHLECWTERLRLDGAQVDGPTGLAALTAVREAAERSGIRPGFFEALTVAGLWLARRSGVDWCIIEAGVGARADATNVVQPSAVVLISIELEHVERLGTSLAAIAREKAGAIKAGAPVISPVLATTVESEIDAATARAGTTRLRVAPAGSAPAADIHWQLRGQHLDLRDASGSLHLPCDADGPIMAGNAALAAATVQALGIASREQLQRSARDWSCRNLPGRFETLSQLPWIVVDCAHTGASAQALAEQVRARAPEEVTLLLSLSTGKDLAAVIDPLASLARTVIVTRADPDYSLPPDPVVAHLAAHWPEVDVHALSMPDAALARASTAATANHLILATGSVYLAGWVRCALRIRPPQ